jgi:hypothetical protein
MLLGMAASLVLTSCKKNHDHQELAITYPNMAEAADPATLFTTANGGKLNGIPNPAGMGASGETSYDLNGQIILPSADEIDSEGLVRASDGNLKTSILIPLLI